MANAVVGMGLPTKTMGSPILSGPRWMSTFAEYLHRRGIDSDWNTWYSGLTTQPRAWESISQRRRGKPAWLTAEVLLWKVGFLKKLDMASRETGWGFRVAWLTERECCSKQKGGVLTTAKLGHTGRANPS